MRIALAQINPTLADFKNNKDKVLEFIIRAKEKKAELVIFPEAALFGYHPFDLLERKSLVKQQLQQLKSLIKAIPADIHVLVGGFDINSQKKGRPFFNAAFLFKKNKLVKTFYKELLPTGDVFDEGRFIEKGSLQKNYFKIKNKVFFITICEDIWAWENTNGKSDYTSNPLLSVKKNKTDLVINLSASPFYHGKLKQREYLVSRTARYFKAPMAYVNMVGAQDEIIFDGQSFVVDAKGSKKLICQSFAEDLNVFELETLTDWNASTRLIKKQMRIAQTHKALVLGLQDFLKKTRIENVHLGLSGGIDSAVVACLAVDAIGADRVRLFALPTEFNKPESFALANKLASNLKIPLQTISIQPFFNLLKKELDKNFQIKQFGLMHENIQSRLRGLIMMAYSNAKNSMLLTTGNKSEYATGYATLYGDMCGGLAPIGDLTKDEVYALARYYNTEYELIPNEIITRAPSAELRPNQKDQDSLPAYNKLDAAVVSLVENHQSLKNETEEWLMPMLMKTEFKRWQAAPILKVTKHSFGRGRRYPIAHRAQE